MTKELAVPDLAEKGEHQTRITSRHRVTEYSGFPEQFRLRPEFHQKRYHSANGLDPSIGLAGVGTQCGARGCLDVHTLCLDVPVSSCFSNP